MRTFYLRRGVMLQLVTVPSYSVTSFLLLSRLFLYSLCSLIHSAHVSLCSAHFPLPMDKLWTSYGYLTSFPFICLYLHLWPRAPFPSCHVSDITLALITSCFCTRIPSRASLSLYLC